MYTLPHPPTRLLCEGPPGGFRLAFPRAARPAGQDILGSQPPLYPTKPLTNVGILERKGVENPGVISKERQNRYANVVFLKLPPGEPLPGAPLLLPKAFEEHPPPSGSNLKPPKKYANVGTPPRVSAKNPGVIPKPPPKKYANVVFLEKPAYLAPV